MAVERVASDAQHADERQVVPPPADARLVTGPLTAAAVLRLQRRAGNAAVVRMIDAGAVTGVPQPCGAGCSCHACRDELELEERERASVALRTAVAARRSVVDQPTVEHQPRTTSLGGVPDRRSGGWGLLDSAAEGNVRAGAFNSWSRAHQPASLKAEGNRVLAVELPHVMRYEDSRTPRLQRETSGGEEEDAERAKILAEFTDGAGLSDRQLGRINAAMRAFSLHQLRTMRKSGVRFWEPNSLPPEFSGRVKLANLSTPAEYVDLIRIIRLSSGASTDAIRHEMAHAWDHVRTGKVKPIPIEKLSDKDFEKALKETPELSSATNVKRDTKEVSGGKERSVRLTISEMLERYRSWKLREQCFDNPTTRESHSKASPREFYAEGYSVFHGGSEWSQAKLLYYAPELYNLLEAEAKQEGLTVPDRAKVEASMKEQGLSP